MAIRSSILGSSAMILRSLLKFCAGILVGTFLFEGALRVAEVWPLWKVAPVVQASFYGPDPDTGYQLRPNREGLWITEHRAWKYVNKDGYLGPTHSPPRSPDAVRVAVVGDSIVESLQVPDEKTFVRQSEIILAQDHGPIEMMNFGLAGASVAVSAARMDHIIRSVSPTLIFLILNSAELLDAQPGDDSAYPAYKSDAAGNVIRSTGFRQSIGFKMRSGTLGSILYWSLDHLRMANILNNRKNIGFFSELAKPAVAPSEGKPSVNTTTCSFYHERTSAVQSAILDDLSSYPDGEQPQLILALTGLSRRCSSEPSRHAVVKEVSLAFSQRLPAFTVLDWDAQLLKRLPNITRDIKGLNGFGRDLGKGHLNEKGHALYAAALADAIQAFLTQHKEVAD